MSNEKRYTRIKMEYPDLGWDQIQALREKLGSEDRKLVEGLLNKIETLFWELEQARVTVVNGTADPITGPDFFHIATLGDAAHTSCSCPICVPLKYAART